LSVLRFKSTVSVPMFPSSPNDFRKAKAMIACPAQPGCTPSLPAMRKFRAVNAPVPPHHEHHRTKHIGEPDFSFAAISIPMLCSTQRFAVQVGDRSDEF